MQNIKVKNGTYTNLQRVRNNTYTATFKMCDGYTEQRVCTVINNEVVAWQS
jgi:hypothetical protein